MSVHGNDDSMSMPDDCSNTPAPGAEAGSAEPRPAERASDGGLLFYPNVTTDCWSPIERSSPPPQPVLKDNEMVASAKVAGTKRKLIEMNEIEMKIEDNLIKMKDLWVEMAEVCVARFEEYVDEGKAAEAMEVGEEALDFKTKAYGPDHIIVAHWRTALAHEYTLLGKDEVAMELYQKSLSPMIKAQDPSVKDSYAGIAEVFRLQGKFEQAVGLHKKALDFRMQELGPDHADVETSYNSIAEVYAEWALSLPSFSCEKEDKLKKALRNQALYYEARADEAHGGIDSDSDSDVEHGDSDSDMDTDQAHGPVYGDSDGDSEYGDSDWSGMDTEVDEGDM